MTTPQKAHSQACAAAGIDGLTLHGLRRSFKSLTEWLEIPAGVVAQIMGHKPSAIAEKHYRRRPHQMFCFWRGNPARCALSRSRRYILSNF
jgi:integrase